MIHILYVPKDKEPLEYHALAQRNGCRQIIHGPSDIINNYLDNKEDVCVVMIPENVYLMISEKVIPEHTRINFKFVNEFISDMKNDKPIDLEIYSGYEKKEIVDRVEMIYDGYFSYDADYSFDLYGEYVVKVTGVNKNNDVVSFCEEEIIVFKPSESNNEVEFNFDS